MAQSGSQEDLWVVVQASCSWSLPVPVKGHPMRLFLLSFLPDFVKPSIFCKDFVVTGVESALPSFKVVATGQFRVLS